MFKIYLYLAPILALFFIVLNYLISINNSYSEKNGPFECGFTSYQQSRSAFSVAFILVAILFLPFDLSILIIFLLSLVIAFVYEINLGALNLERRFTPIVKPLITRLYNK